MGYLIILEDFVMNIRVVQTEKERDACYQILIERVKWMHAKGIRQWEEPYPKNLFEEAYVWSSFSFKPKWGH